MKKTLLLAILSSYTLLCTAQTPTLKIEFGTPEPTKTAPVSVDVSQTEIRAAVPVTTSTPRPIQRMTAILYSSSNDGNSNQAKAWLTSRGIDFVEKSIEFDQNLKDLHADGGNSVPFLKYGDQIESGFSDQTYNLIFFGK